MSKRLSDTENISKMNEPFTKLMRKSTREIHGLSDTLINAKLGFALSDNAVWAEGLLVFYEIFKHLEKLLDKTNDVNLLKLDIKGMRRTEQFEKDLTYYLGKEWKENYTIRPSVKEYISHLNKLELKEPILLTAYIYHLYMGLFAGGQILKKKRALIMKMTFSKEDIMRGLSVVDVGGTNTTVYSLKKEMREAMDNLANQLDQETKLRLIEEGKMVFILNNKIVHSIQGTNAALFSKFIKLVGVVTIVAISAYFMKKVLPSASII